MDCLLLGPVKDRVVDRKHGGDGEYFNAALVRLGFDEGFAQHRVARKLGHSPAEFRELTPIVQGPERVQLLQSANEGFRRRWVHEVEVQEIVYSQAFKHQDHVSHVGALDVWHGLLLELVHEGPVGVEAKALPRLRAAGAPRALLSGGPRNWCHDQRFHPGARVVRLLLTESSIDHIADAIDGKTCLSNIRAKDDLSCSLCRFFEYFRLLLGWQRRVNWAHRKLFYPRT
mmetsp:Transcript_11887/g.27867  ORF Transcript_11887/g.27867 Transcript_11887/m.27867 type:complete len:229 (+) Transcript_11887:764-1450(+)